MLFISFYLISFKICIMFFSKTQTNEFHHKINNLLNVLRVFRFFSKYSLKVFNLFYDIFKFISEVYEVLSFEINREELLSSYE